MLHSLKVEHHFRKLRTNEYPGCQWRFWPYFPFGTLVKPSSKLCSLLLQRCHEPQSDVFRVETWHNYLLGTRQSCWWLWKITGVTDGSPVDSAWCGLHELTSEVLESHPARSEFVQAAPCWIAKWSTIPNRPKRSLVVRSMNKATTLEQCRFLSGASADRNKTRKVTRATLCCLQVTEAFWNLVICCWCYAADCESGGRFVGGFWVNASVKKWLWPVDQSKHPVSFSVE